tara:strand:+ start:1309 stop:1482 length:174 start_codon:yes stop_codon:yes gene_type:complete
MINKIIMRRGHDFRRFHVPEKEHIAPTATGASHSHPEVFPSPFSPPVINQSIDIAND